MRNSEEQKHLHTLLQLFAYAFPYLEHLNISGSITVWGITPLFNISLELIIRGIFEFIRYGEYGG